MMSNVRSPDWMLLAIIDDLDRAARRGRGWRVAMRRARRRARRPVRGQGRRGQRTVHEHLGAAAERADTARATGARTFCTGAAGTKSVNVLPCPTDAGQGEFAAEQPRDLPRNGQPEPRAAVFARGRAVGLLERLEDEALFLWRDADAGIRHAEGDDAAAAHCRRLIERVVIRAPTAVRRGHPQGDAPALGELERVGKQVLQHLIQPLAVGLDRAWQTGSQFDLEADALVLGDVAEGALHRLAHLAQRHAAQVQRDRAALDLGQIEDVVDEVEQVLAAAVDRLGKLHLPPGEVAIRVAGELVREDEQAVEWRAQLVAHVGQELALVLGSECQLLGFLLQRAAGLFDLAVLVLDLAVLAFDLGVLIDELPGFLFQLQIAGLQLLLAALQFVGERLRLLEQVLRQAVGLDGIEHDADAFRQLVQERLVRLAEPLEAG